MAQSLPQSLLPRPPKIPMDLPRKDTQKSNFTEGVSEGVNDMDKKMKVEVGKFGTTTPWGIILNLWEDVDHYIYVEDAKELAIRLDMAIKFAEKQNKES